MEQLPIGVAVARLADEAPDRPLVTHEDRTVTRREFDRRTNRLARAYERLGVKQDDLVTLALPNGVEFFEAAFALWKLGATPQPVSPRMPERELRALVDLADPPVVIGVPDGTLSDRIVVPPGFEPDASLSDDALPERVAGAWKAPTSGGSTGRPKIIVSTNKGLTQPGVQALFGIPEGGVQLAPGPLYHNAPFMLSCVGLTAGNHLVVVSRFDASATLELVERHRVQWMWLVPTMMSRIIRLPDGERLGRDVSSLERVWHGAAACPAWVKQAWIDWLEPDLIWELYAGTEAQAVTIIGGREWLEHRGSVGRPITGVMKVIDPVTGDELPAGDVGEIVMHHPGGASATYRYVGAEPKKVLDDDWESIGDMGWFDADGFLYIADRRSDLIVTGGANVYPAEVEAALDEHPAVRTCAAIGLPDEDLGHRVHAIVETDGDVSDAELRAFLAERLAPYKIPRSFERSAEPLRDDAGKTRRAQLREERIRALTDRD